MHLILCKHFYVDLWVTLLLVDILLVFHYTDFRWCLWIFIAQILVTEKCVWYSLALAVWCNPLAKCELGSVNFEA